MLPAKLPLGEQLFRLDGRTALVTGAAGHIGRALCRAMAEAGARVLINGRDAARAEAFAAELARSGYDARAVPFDVMDTDAVHEMCAAHDAAGQPLDILINNAITMRPGGLDQASEQDFDSALRSSITAAFTLTRAALPCLQRAARQSGHASVINVASMYGLVSPDPSVYGDSGLDSPPHYAAAKGGLVQLTRWMACHLADKRIRVNAIAPGAFPRQEFQERHPDLMARLTEKVPMKRLGQPDELRGAVLFLASDAASYVTGTTLPVDGGWTAW
jgi:NAD(P)-dependent dehydrogenase (short-subunit alcohol dehydrogenase family)